MTLKDAIYHKHHRSSAYALVRSRARTIARKLNLTTCIRCGYNKHVEIAHIKAISEFDETALLSEINSKENLMPLCPNCHWENDNIKVA
ncbi:MAG: HNH endonuclease [Bacteroidota bacterium]